MTEKVWPGNVPEAHKQPTQTVWLLVLYFYQSCIWWAFNNQYLMEGLRNLTSKACTRFFQIVKIHPIFAFHKEMHVYYQALL